MRKRKLKKEAESYVPEWEGVLKRWTFSYARRNMRKFYDPAISLDDLVQDGYLLFRKLCEKYPNASSAGHFFTLYETSYVRAFYDRIQDAHLSNSVLDRFADVYIVEGVSDAGTMAAYLSLLTEAPEELLLVLSAHADANLLAELRKPYRHKPGPYRSVRGQPRESYNSRLCRLIGISPRDLVGPIREALTTGR